MCHPDPNRPVETVTYHWAKFENVSVILREGLKSGSWLACVPENRDGDVCLRVTLPWLVDWDKYDVHVAWQVRLKEGIGPEAISIHIFNINDGYIVPKRAKSYVEAVRKKRTVHWRRTLNEFETGMWKAGVLSVNCSDCATEYSDPGWVDVSVPDDIWEQINPTDLEGGGLLCLTCMTRRLRLLGLVDVPMKITSGPYAIDPEAPTYTVAERARHFIDFLVCQNVLYPSSINVPFERDPWEDLLAVLQTDEWPDLDKWTKWEGQQKAEWW
jgi:hypothetical protein